MIKYWFATCCFCFLLTSLNAQFQPTDNGLTIIVTDGTYFSRHSKVTEPDDIPASYDQIENLAGGKKSQLVFTDPIVELGMADCIQAAAFLERPKYGKAGFMLIFSLDDSIGGKQAELFRDGEVYKGVYRLIRQKSSPDEPVPPGMTTYQIAGTFLLLGIS